MNPSLLELLSMYSHELKSPIASCQSMLMVMDLKKNSLTPAEIHQYHKKMAGKLQALTMTTDSLYDVIALQNKDFPLSLEVADPFELIELVIAVIKREKDTTISFSHPEKNVTVLVDRTKIIQALRSLLYFVSDSVEGDGHIEIAVESREKKLDLTINFEGTSITEADQKKLFTLEYCLEKINGKKVTPALFVAAEVIKLHKGAITFVTHNTKNTIKVSLTLEA